jgi:hypothetical protein
MSVTIHGDDAYDTAELQFLQAAYDTAEELVEVVRLYADLFLRV